MKTSRCATIAVVLLAGGVWRLGGQTAVDLTRQGKLGTGATVPSQCAVGQVFFKTGAPAGANLYSCTSANVWSVVGLIPLGGDMSGTAPGATVTGLQGRPVSSGSPSDQDALRWNAGSGLWVPGAVIGVGSAPPPATCSTGGLYLRNDTADNFHQLYVCSNTNVWSMASIQAGTGLGRPANCLLGQTWLATDTGAMTYCSATGSPGTWSFTLAGPAGSQGPTGATGPQGPQGPAGALGGASGQIPYNNSGTAAGSNLSQNTDGSLSANKAFNSPLCTVTLSATPVFDASQCNAFSLTLGNTTVTGSTLLNAKAGQSLTFTIIQDAAGGRSFIWPTNLSSGCPVNPAAHTSTDVTAIFDGTNANATGCTTSDLSTLIAGPTRSAPGTPSTGLACWFDSSANTLLCKDPSGNVYATTKSVSARTANQFLTYVDASGMQHTATIAAADVPTLNQSTNGNAATATALASAPPTCSAGQGATGVNASGTAQGCTAYVQLAGDLGNTAASPQVTATHLASGLPRAQGGLNSTSAGSGLLRDGTTPTAAELSGDCTTSGSNVVTCTKLNNIAFAGTSGHLVSFGAADIPADSGVVAANTVVASYPGAGIAHFAGGTQAVTSSPVSLTADVSGTLPAANLPTAVKSPHSCDMAFGDTSASSVLTNAQLGPQVGICFIPAAATIVEIDVRADGGTPQIVIGRELAGTVLNLTSAALATGASGARACSKTTALTGLDASTTCSATLQNTALAVGTYLQAVSGTAGGTAKWMTVHVIYNFN